MNARNLTLPWVVYTICMFVVNVAVSAMQTAVVKHGIAAGWNISALRNGTVIVPTFLYLVFSFALYWWTVTRMVPRSG